MQKTITTDLSLTIKEKDYISIETINKCPKRSILEEVGNSVTHGVGALMAIAMLVLMILKSSNGFELAAALVYGISMIIMMTMSCLYHAFKSDTKVKRLFRRFDYCSIYLLIGGTYAPLFLIYLGNTLGIVLFCIQWALIILGVTLVSIFGPDKVKKLNFILYFCVGWAGVLFIPVWIKTELPLLLWILFGGLAYTLGMIPFSKKDLKGAHFIWHFFVLLGFLIQWFGIYINVF